MLNCSPLNIEHKTGEDTTPRKNKRKSMWFAALVTGGAKGTPFMVHVSSVKPPLDRHFKLRPIQDLVLCPLLHGGEREGRQASSDVTHTGLHSSAHRRRCHTLSSPHLLLVKTPLFSPSPQGAWEVGPSNRAVGMYVAPPTLWTLLTVCFQFSWKLSHPKMSNLLVPRKLFN